MGAHMNFSTRGRARGRGEGLGTDSWGVHEGEAPAEAESFEAFVRLKQCPKV